MAIEVDVVLDTNILLRTTFDQPGQLSSESQACLELWRRGYTIGTTVANLSEFASVATRPAYSNGLGLTVQQSLRRIEFFEEYLASYSESLQSYGLWKQLLSFYDVKGKSVHDARIVAIMLESQIPAILTLNLPDFQRFPEVTVLHPDDLPPGVRS